MANQKYEIEKHSVETVLSWIKTKEVVIPEIQRPFVWKATQVRDLIDSLYNGYPVGYLIVSRSHEMRLKDGTMSKGQRILIDGQQRVTALMASILGMSVLNNQYKKRTIRIAYNPFAKDDENLFEVQDQSHLKSKKWIEDISIFFNDEFDDYTFIEDFCTVNPEMDRRELNRKIKKIIDIKTKDLGIIELSSSLDIDIVTDVFIRINSKGAVLSQADFAMSKIAADEKYGGNMLRKAIDYFCHVAIEPSFYDTILKNDTSFIESEFGKEMAWLRNDNESIFDPSYEDMLRVSFVHMFSRGKLKDLVSLLSGRDFETRDYKEEIAEESFSKLTEGIKHFMHQYYFEQFILAIKSAGFINSKLINSQNALDFSYVVYLKLVLSGEVDKTKIKRCVAKWFTMSILTGRYSSSPETRMDQDIRNINDKGVINYLNEIENAELSDAFWDFGLPQKLDTPNSTAPALSTFFAAQIVKGDKGLFSPNSSVRDLFGVSDVHHIFPKDYLKKTEFLDNRSIYNQVANYTYLDTPINIAVGNKAPNVYFKEAFESALKDEIVYGNHMSVDELKSNLIENCIPLDIVNWDYNDYRNKFLVERRKLMAKKIKEYYNNL
ncbi:MAG TPA: hypothetical protein DIU44_01085 [Acholeplasmatales bacterium]|nr:hypothetical protein [Acholeplasmatales bacterium]